MFRKPGYYWCRLRYPDKLGVWEIALWENDSWWIMYRDWSVEESEFADIHPEPIQMPRGLPA